VRKLKKKYYKYRSTENSHIMKRFIKYTILLLLLSSGLHAYAISQDEEPRDIYLEFSTWKYNDDSRSLIAKVTSDNDEGEYPVEGLTFQFLALNGKGDTLLGESVSEAAGIAELNLADGSIDFPMDEDGYIHFIARFPGNESYYEAEEELMIKDVNISISFEETEEEKLIYFQGTIHGPEGDMPLADDDLYFFVPRMFSDMKIADGWFEEDGTGYVEFPGRIIGDSLGNIKVMARLVDHFDYGNVEVSDEVDWAVPRVLIQAEGPARELWTPIAPVWMIVTLIIMLTGVWGHYIYAIIQLIKIKNSKSQ
jgi:hypothetical protein